MDIRQAQLAEEERISRILTNAFLPVWNHNWFQGVSAPISSLPMAESLSNESPSLSAAQETRRKFYLALIRLVRLSGGSVNVMLVDDQIVAVLLWSPPHKRPSLWHIVSSGFLRVALYGYGLKSTWRVQMIFEYNVARMIMDRKIAEPEHGFVQMLGTDPKHAGHGYGAELLRYMFSKHKAEYPQSPGVLLDTTTVQAQRVYEKLGFESIGRRAVHTGCDVDGYKLSRDDADYEAKRQEALKVHIQQVMLLKF